MAASSSSLSSCSIKYDVFLSFRGIDTRTKFTSHLCNRLCDKGVNTYIDNRLERGDIISAALVEAIRSSMISVIVFSENYASSPWCLDEILCILECKKQRGQVVVPVFYEVDPSTVRHQSGSYQHAFARLQERFEVEQVDNWKAALKQVADLSGWHLQQYMSGSERTESDFVNAIVKDIIKKLNNISSSDEFKDLVGIRENVEEVEKLLCIDSHDVWMIGILGMGGLGKTTLARVLFKRLSSLFDGHCFLQNVREESERLGLHKLQKNLFSALLAENDLSDITDFHKDRLRRKKVLVVLDDVDPPQLLEDLAGDKDWFGTGSKVIVTTRNHQVLRNRADNKYELKGLNSQCSLELFCMSAFKKNNSPTEDDITVSSKVLTYADGIPLALKVLGSFLRSKRRENWDIELERFKQVPNRTVQNVLKVSYDGLEEQEQKVFLDIVCFVKIEESECMHCVERMLGGGSLQVDIDNLIDRSLIYFEDGSLTMHDLVREMGCEIVRQESVESPGKRSRLFNKEDCYQVFKNNTGTKTIKGISAGSFRESVQSNPSMFNKMDRLWFLRIDSFSINFTGELHCLPSALKYLRWSDWPFKSFPENFRPNNLVEIRMTESNLQRLWSGDQELGNLKYVDLSFSFDLTDVSALSHAPNLESVDFFRCRKLRDFPSLRFGDLDKCYHEREYVHCSYPGRLNFRGCNSLEFSGRISGNVKILDLCDTPIKELPPSITSLQNLDHLILSYCKFLKSLPINFQNLHSLKCLDLYLSYSFTMLPVLPRNLTKLVLDNTLIEQVPSETSQGMGFQQFSKLTELSVRSCNNLKSLSELPLTLELVEARGCKRLTTVSNLNDLLQGESWIDYDVTRSRSFIYYECPLDESTRNRMEKEFQLRVLHTAATVVLTDVQVRCSLDILMGFPDYNIPKWFTHKSDTSTTNANLASNWHNNDFLGFALCVVFVTNPMTYTQQNLCADLAFKTENRICATGRQGNFTLLR